MALLPQGASLRRRIGGRDPLWLVSFGGSTYEVPAGEATPPLVEIEFDMLYINFIHADLFSNYQEEAVPVAQALALAFVQQHQAIEQVREDSKKVKWAGVAVTAAAAASLFMRK